MLFMWPFGESRWDPSVSPAEIRRRHEASKRERASQDAARHAEIRRSIEETERLSRMPIRSGRSLRAVNIYRDRQHTSTRPTNKTGSKSHPVSLSSNPTSVTPRARSFGELARNYYTRDVGAGERTELISAQSRGGSR